MQITTNTIGINVEGTLGRRSFLRDAVRSEDVRESGAAVEAWLRWINLRK